MQLPDREPTVLRQDTPATSCKGPWLLHIPDAVPPRLPEREPTVLPLLQPVLCLILLAAG